MDGWMWQQLILHFINAAPWLAGLLGGLAIVSFGPLGTAIRARLLRSTRGADDPRLDQIAADVAQVLERLDYLERLAVQDPRRLPPPLPPPPAPSRQTTPT